MELTPFNPEATCPKCGGEVVIVQYWPDALGKCRYHRKMNYINRHDPGLPLPKDDEHFHRVCGRCMYTWREEVLG